MKLLCLLSLLALLVITQNTGLVFADKVVLTESGQLCHFPFHYGRMIYHSCIGKGKQGPRKWCSLTKNYDKDQHWSYCIEGHDVKDHCEENLCEPKGTCQSTLKGYKCVCKEPFTGQHCQTDKCYDKKLQLYFEPRASWLRYIPPVLEECVCSEKGSICKIISGSKCSDNPCLHGGLCIQAKRAAVCGCTQGHIGKHCEIRQQEYCFTGNGTGYRGTGNVTISETPCLHWDSEIILHEMSMYGGHKEKIHGLGSHSYCRNPDGDTQPWCFVLKEQRLSWEHCFIPRCTQPAVSTATPKHFESASPTRSFNQSVIISSPPTGPNGLLNGSAVLPVDCGRKFKKSPSITPRIVGGLVALPASHPYMAALYIGKQFCGGALISSCWILTAAHCLERRPNVTSISVVLGQSLFNTTDQHTINLPVEKYILHHKYSLDTLQNDVGKAFSQFVQPICLPLNVKQAEGTKQCVVVGWGHQYEGAGHYSFFLQEAFMPIVPYSQCQAPNIHGQRMMPGMLCAGIMEGGVDACQGDSGGPLVCEVDGRIELHGIVSWGTGCGEENKPGVYTRVQDYTDWIRASI
ncbi:hypothetical protein GDO86_005525 [Hymenochirus boettgeri]|uniref:Coagulation factor XII n=1 Tax=Hymenochirus boettgeri TaxID=247094 RepID=A0A8T2J7M8_9PIPI|nr:hypothetical protein GDO86_005525 [Hymenochirus boettgeri]